MLITARNFSVLLWLIAIHSMLVGLLLITIGESGIQYFGFSSGNEFFQVQGGVFHLVMCVAYILTATELRRSKRLVIFIIAAKSIALVYLLVYYFMVDAILIIFLAGIADGLMALLVAIFLRNMPNNYFKGGRR